VVSLQLQGHEQWPTLGRSLAAVEKQKIAVVAEAGYLMQSALNVAAQEPLAAGLCNTHTQ